LVLFLGGQHSKPGTKKGGPGRGEGELRSSLKKTWRKGSVEAVRAVCKKEVSEDRRRGTKGDKQKLKKTT